MLKVLARAMRQEQKHTNWKERKLFLFIDDMILYIENPRYSTKKLIRTNKQVQQSYRIQDKSIKLIVFLYTSNEQ